MEGMCHYYSEVRDDLFTRNGAKKQTHTKKKDSKIKHRNGILK